jgi:hypothetical protein
MGAHARDRYLALYGHDRMVARITSLYLRLPGPVGRGTDITAVRRRAALGPTLS